MDIIFLSLLAILVTVIAHYIYKFWKINQYFKEKNIPHLKPLLFFGNVFPTEIFKKTYAEHHHYICKQFPNEPIVGYYDFTTPTLLVKDPEMIEKILIKDFIHFVDHGFPVDEDRNPLDSNLFTMTGKRWKAVRNKLSPIFTTGKLKMMYNTIADCCDELMKLMESSEEEIEMRNVLSRFSIDVIGSCAFGIEVKNLADPDNEFRRIGRRNVETSTFDIIKYLIITNFPFVNKIINIPFNKDGVAEYFTKIIKDTVKYRRENNYVRNDFVQLMMQLQDKGYVEVHTKDAADDYLNIDNNTYTTEKFEMTDDQLTGQAIFFLTAGFEATTLTMMYTLYELSKHPEIQKKVREEVQRETKLAGSITYDAVKEMRFLEQCINEAQRKYLPAPVLMRVCTKEYTLPNGATISPGQLIMVPMRAVNYNPTYYPEPEKFKPERFDPDQTLPPCAFLPFGNGPRICIAMRFALLQMKHCLAKLLLNYSFQISPNTKEPLTMNPKSLISTPKEKIYFITKKIN